jgi:hypothetical protein
MKRPVKELHKRLMARFTVRFTEKEKGFLLEEADACGMTISAFIRGRSLGKRITAKTDLRVVAELRRLGGLLKNIHNESKGAYSALTANCVKEITAYIQRLDGEFRGKDQQTS